MSEYCENCYKLQAQYDKVVEQNRQLQQELREKTAECEELKKALKTAGHLIQNALDAEETDDADKRLECIYKALDIINKAKDGEE